MTPTVMQMQRPLIYRCILHEGLLLPMSCEFAGASNLPRDEGNAVLPSQAGEHQLIRLPGQTRVSPEEYKEFLGLGHGDVFDLDPDRFATAHTKATFGIYSIRFYSGSCRQWCSQYTDRLPCR